MADALVSIVLERSPTHLGTSERFFRMRERQVKDEAVKIWLEDLKGLAYDMDNVLDEWSSSILKVQIQELTMLSLTRRRCACIPFPCFPIRGFHICHDIALKIGEINRRLDTTLAQLAYNDVKVCSHFDKRIWVCVSDPFDAMRISRAILEALERKTSSHLHELEIVQQEIQNSIARKKFLLVSDDVWNENYRFGSW
ncbi:hypothetical protein AAG906_021388 [Vitis piasezkii]